MPDSRGPKLQVYTSYWQLQVKTSKNPDVLATTFVKPLSDQEKAKHCVNREHPVQLSVHFKSAFLEPPTNGFRRIRESLQKKAERLQPTPGQCSFHSFLPFATSVRKPCSANLGYSALRSGSTSHMTRPRGIAVFFYTCKECFFRHYHAATPGTVAAGSINATTH